LASLIEANRIDRQGRSLCQFSDLHRHCLHDDSLHSGVWSRVKSRRKRDSNSSEVAVLKRLIPRASLTGPDAGCRPSLCPPFPPRRLVRGGRPRAGEPISPNRDSWSLTIGRSYDALGKRGGWPTPPRRLERL
jgi:hypothetical protein